MSEIEILNGKQAEYDKLYEEFRKTHCKLYIIGIDLGSEPDRTAYSPPIKV